MRRELRTGRREVGPGGDWARKGRGRSKKRGRRRFGRKNGSGRTEGRTTEGRTEGGDDGGRERGAEIRRNRPSFANTGKARGSGTLY